MNIETAIYKLTKDELFGLTASVGCSERPNRKMDKYRLRGLIFAGLTREQRMAPCKEPTIDSIIDGIRSVKNDRS